MIEVEMNRTFVPYYENRARHLVLYGGAGSGKSVFAAQKIVLRTRSEAGHTFLCLRKIRDRVAESIFQEIKDVISSMGIWNEFVVNKSNHEFMHINGNRILCKGLDEPEKIKSIKGITGMWVEEATEFKEEDLDQLNLRIRGQHTNYVQFIYSFNPIDEEHHIKKRFMDRGGADVAVLHTTYKDNHYLTQTDIDAIESYKETNLLYYDIYCLGKWGIVDKSNKFCYAFSDEHISDVGLDARFPLWLSFDFNKDPMTCIAGQKINDTTAYIERQFKLNQGSTPEMCDIILATFPGWDFIVTGDATGRNRTSLVRGNLNHIKYIQKALNLSQPQVRFRNTNLSHIDSRLLCNMILLNTDMKIDSTCKDLIDQMKFAKVDEYGELVKDREENKNDLLDCWRYMVSAWYPRYINRLHKNYDRTPIYELNANNGSTHSIPRANGFSRV